MSIYAWWLNIDSRGIIAKVLASMVSVAAPGFQKWGGQEGDNELWGGKPDFYFWAKCAVIPAKARKREPIFFGRQDMCLERT